MKRKGWRRGLPPRQHAQPHNRIVLADRSNRLRQERRRRLTLLFEARLVTIRLSHGHKGAKQLSGAKMVNLYRRSSLLFSFSLL